MYAQTSQAPVRWLNTFRLSTAGVGLGLLFLAVESGAQPARLPYAVLAGAALLSVLYAALGRRVADQRRFAGAQIGIDVLLVSTLVYLTGGVYSFATILYFGAVLAAALCVSQGTSFLVASACTVALAGIQIAYALATTEPPILTLPLVSGDFLLHHKLRFGRDTAYLLAQGFALHMVAALGAYLKRELVHVRILYSEILEKMAEGLVVIDKGSRIVFVNHEARRLLGYTKPDALEGRDFREVFRRRQDQEILHCLLSEEPMTVEIEVTTRDGPRAFHVKTTVLKDRGVTRGTIGIFTDLTLRRQAEEAQRSAERLAQLTTLALGIAHEVRNPLASIRGCVQELGRHAFLAEDEQELIRIVCRESDRLDAIVGDFMQFAKMRPPLAAPSDLARVLRDTALLLENREGAGAMKIALDLPAAAPIVADAAQLQQVFLNLGLNAIEATGGRGRLAVSLRTARLGVSGPVPGQPAVGRAYGEIDGYEVRFEDDGPGIPAGDLGQLFVPFFTTKPSGTGLGLPVADRIVKAHGGEIVVQVGPGRGTTFAVRLPASARGHEPPRPAEPQGEGGGAGSAGRGAGLEADRDPGSAAAAAAERSARRREIVGAPRGAGEEG